MPVTRRLGGCPNAPEKPTRTFQSSITAERAQENGRKRRSRKRYVGKTIPPSETRHRRGSPHQQRLADTAEVGAVPEKIEVKSPTMVVTTTPSVMMAAAAAMTPSMTAATSMAAPDLDDGVIGDTKGVRRCDGHCRRREGWSQSKGAGGKSDQQKPFHVSLLPQIALSRQGRKVPRPLGVPDLNQPRYLKELRSGAAGVSVSSAGNQSRAELGNNWSFQPLAPWNLAGIQPTGVQYE